MSPEAALNQGEKFTLYVDENLESDVLLVRAFLESRIQGVIVQASEGPDTPLLIGPFTIVQGLEAIREYLREAERTSSS